MGWRATPEHLNSLAKSLTRSEQPSENTGQGSPLSFHQDEKCCKGKSRCRLLPKINREEGDRDHLQPLQTLWLVTLPCRQLNLFFLFSSFPLQVWPQALPPGHSLPQFSLGASHGLCTKLHLDGHLPPDTGTSQQGGLADRLCPQLRQLAITLSGQEPLV